MRKISFHEADGRKNLIEIINESTTSASVFNMTTQDKVEHVIMLLLSRYTATYETGFYSI